MSGVISGVGLVFSGLGAGIICVGTINTYDAILLNLGINITVLNGVAFLGALPIMITSLAMSAWLKGQTNRLSVDISVTSGGTGELSCDKKRNALEKPSGVALALCVKF